MWASENRGACLYWYDCVDESVKCLVIIWYIVLWFYIELYLFIFQGRKMLLCCDVHEWIKRLSWTWIWWSFRTRNMNEYNDTTYPLIMIKMTIFIHRPYVSLPQCAYCWWHHNQLLMSQWWDNCDVSTWILISNSLGIDYIHGDIHGRLC